MKKNVLYVFFLFVLIISSCSPKYTHVTYEEHYQITNRTRNVDGTRVLLLVDSIPFDSLQFEIIGNKQKRRYFYVPVEYLGIDKTIEYMKRDFDGVLFVNLVELKEMKIKKNDRILFIFLIIRL